MSAAASQISSMMGQTTQVLGQSVVYTPIGGSALPAFNAVIESASSEISEMSGFSISDQDRRFLIQNSDYSTDPKVGDIISYGGNVYTVMIPEGGRHCWEWHDKFNVRRCVFTRRTT